MYWLSIFRITTYIFLRYGSEEIDPLKTVPVSGNEIVYGVLDGSGQLYFRTYGIVMNIGLYDHFQQTGHQLRMIVKSVGDQLSRENIIFRPRSLLRSWSRDLGTVPCQPGRSPHPG